MFKFRLERLLQLKTSQENQVKMELAAVRMKIHNLQEQIEFAENSLSDLYNTMLQSSSRGITGVQLSQWLIYVDFQKTYLRELYRRLDQLKEDEENLKEQYLAVRRDKKILQNLKARRFKRYLSEQDRINRLYLDEVALRKVVRGER